MRGERNLQTEEFVRFHANQNNTVYIGYHVGLTKLPDWLSHENGWRVSSEYVSSHDDPYFMLEQSFNAGDISLGQNLVDRDSRMRGCFIGRG